MGIKCLNDTNLSKVGVLTAPYSIGEDTNRGRKLNLKESAEGLPIYSLARC